METIDVLCWIYGQDVEKIFSVEISKTETVEALKEAIKDKNSVKFRDVQANKLSLYSIPIPEDDKRFHAELKRLSLKDKPSIGPLVKISKLFPESGGEWLIVVDGPISALRATQPHAVVPYMTLNCWVHGEDVNCVFPVEIPRAVLVGTLKEVIKEHNPVDFGDIDASSLTLYKASLSADKDIKETLATLTLRQEDLLQPLDPLFYSFPDAPLPRHIHVIIEAPLSGRKRAHEEADDDAVKLTKRARIVTEPPSNMAQPQSYRVWHRNLEDPVFDHRLFYGDGGPPGYDPYVPPISLQYEGFGHFLDIFHGREGVPGMEKVPSARLQLAVDNFAEQMSLIYPEEQVRRSRGLVALDDIFSVRTDKLSFGLGTLDGHIVGDHNAAYCIVKFKNEPANISTIPYIELVGHFAHTTCYATTYSTLVMRGWNFPCLGLTIIGHNVTFYAMIYFGRWRIVSLTPELSCIRASGDGADRLALYKAFTAASVLLAHIKEVATQLVNRIPPPIQGSRTLPPISSLSHPRSGGRIEFTILESFSDRATDRHLYLAEMTDKKKIIVKFTRRYSPELHMFCAEREHAPPLLGFERLPGGFFAVAMEFVTPLHPISTSLYVGKHREWAEQLQKLVASFHAEDFVHGDLRTPNVVCDGNRVMVIDFDWAGKVGEAFYPSGPLNTDLTDGRDSADLKITKADDLRVLCKTLKKIQLQ